MRISQSAAIRPRAWSRPSPAVPGSSGTNLRSSWRRSSGSMSLNWRPNSPRMSEAHMGWSEWGSPASHATASRRHRPLSRSLWAPLARWSVSRLIVIAGVSCCSGDSDGVAGVGLAGSSGDVADGAAGDDAACDFVAGGALRDLADLGFGFLLDPLALAHG